MSIAYKINKPDVYTVYKLLCTSGFNVDNIQSFDDDICFVCNNHNVNWITEYMAIENNYTIKPFNTTLELLNLI
jgi:hypothetical protein